MSEQALLVNCNICNKNFEKIFFDKHIKVHLNSCHICGYKLKNKRSVFRHVKQKHTDEKGFKCTELNCNTTFKRNENLVKHKLMKHDDTISVNCNKCNKNFKTISNMKRHLKNVCKGIFEK